MAEGEGISTQDIARKGWEHFRERESHYLEHALSNQNQLIIIGGGTNAHDFHPYIQQNINLIKQKALNICLYPFESIEESAKLLKNRLIAKPGSRLSVGELKSPVDELYEQLKARTDFYHANADHMIYVGADMPKLVVEKILKEVKDLKKYGRQQFWR